MTAGNPRLDHPGPQGPALTAEQWASVGVVDVWPEEGPDTQNGEVGVYIEGGAAFYSLDLTQGERHRMAALCMHGQTFGFTWSDVRHLRRLMDFVIPKDEGTRSYVLREHTKSIANRIAALLPPDLRDAQHDRDAEPSVEDA